MEGQALLRQMPPFGLRSSPFLFNTVATALEYIMKSQLNTRYVLHYLDDFLFAGPPDSHMCGDILQGAEALCECLGVQVKPEKRTSPTTCITFLGIELDTVAQIARVPQDKLSPLLADRHEFYSRHKCTKRELLSLIGRLAFAAKVIPTGRMFLRRLIEARPPLVVRTLEQTAGCSGHPAEGALCHPCSSHGMGQSLATEEALGPLQQPGSSRHLPHWYLEEHRADAAHPHTIFHGSATQLYTTNKPHSRRG